MFEYELTVGKESVGFVWVRRGRDTGKTSDGKKIKEGNKRLSTKMCGICM